MFKIVWAAKWQCNIVKNGSLAISRKSTRGVRRYIVGTLPFYLREGQKLAKEEERVRDFLNVGVGKWEIR